DVVRLVLETLVVAGPAGGEHRVAHAPAVDLQLVQSVAGDVDTRRAHRLAECELAAEQRRGLRDGIRLGPGRLDPLRSPVLRLQQAHLPKCGSVPRRFTAGAVPHADAPEVARA